LKALLENYLKLSIIFLRNLFEKNQKSKYHFLAFNQLYASLLAKIVLQNLPYSIWVAFQTIFECGFQLLFYKLLFYHFRKNRVRTLVLFLLCKQSFLARMRFYPKPYICFENMLLDGLKTMC
jgi:hypothetical protein